MKEWINKEYERICEKLGFVPSQYVYSGLILEDDNWKNPFEALTIDEIDFLYENGYLTRK